MYAKKQNNHQKTLMIIDKVPRLTRMRGRKIRFVSMNVFKCIPFFAYVYKHRQPLYTLAVNNKIDYFDKISLDYITTLSIIRLFQ